MKEQTLKHLEELLCEELDKFGQKQSISSGDLQYIDVLLHATKNLYKVKENAEGESSFGRSGESSYYSRRGGSYSMQDGSYGYGGGSYGGGSYEGGGGSYEGGGSFRRGRDRMGRFTSRSGGDMVSRLKDMMNETDDPTEKRELREFIQSIEQR